MHQSLISTLAGRPAPSPSTGDAAGLTRIFGSVEVEEAVAETMPAKPFCLRFLLLCLLNLVLRGDEVDAD